MAHARKIDPPKTAEVPMDSHSEESISATVLEFSSETMDPTVLLPANRKMAKAQALPRAMRAAPRRTSRRSAERRAERSQGSGRSLDVGVVLLAGLLLLLPLPSLLDSGNAFVGRLALLLGLIVPPAAVLLMLQRRFGPSNSEE